MTQAQVQTAVAAATVHKLEPPRPLMRALPEAEPFPLDALGALQEAAEDIADFT